jgi:hypothetical protein
MRPSLHAAFVAAVLAAGTIAIAEAQDASNLKVLPKDIKKADLKKLMKAQAASLGVQCDYCHDTDDYAKDTEKKEIGRDMMRMTGEINRNHFKGEPKVGCVTCHNGKKEPKGP